MVLENTATDGVVTEQQGQQVAGFARHLYALAARDTTRVDFWRSPVDWADFVREISRPSSKRGVCPADQAAVLADALFEVIKANRSRFARPDARTARLGWQEMGHGSATMQQVVHVGDLDVNVQVSDRRRSIRLTVERDATLTAVIPPATDEATLAKVIAAKRQWLYAQAPGADAGTGEPRTAERVRNSARASRTSAAATDCCSWMQAPRPVRLNQRPLGATAGQRRTMRSAISSAGTGRPASHGSAGGTYPGQNAHVCRGHHPARAAARLPVGLVHPGRQGQHPLGHHAALPTSWTTCSCTSSPTCTITTTARSSGAPSNALCQTTRPPRPPPPIGPDLWLPQAS